MGQTTFTGPVISQNGFIDASFTDAERDAIVNPQPGLLIYNTTSNGYQVYSGSAWDTAFGGGGGAGWPYYIDGLQSTNVFNPGGLAYYGPIVFNPTGTQYVSAGDQGAAGFKLTYTNLVTPFDATNGATSSGYMSGSGTYDISGGNLVGGFYNADGTAFYTVHNAGMGQAYVATFTLSTPYDAQTASYVTYTTVNYAGPFAGILGFSMSEDGTKATFLFTDSGTIKVTVTPLTTPFNLSTAQYGPEINIDSYFNDIVPNQGSRSIHGLALNSTGTVAYVGGLFSGMMSSANAIVEFRLGTAFDFSTINATYDQTLTGQASLQSYGALTTASSKLYVVGQFMGMSWQLDQYNLTGLSAPNITGVSPSSGTTGTSVTITGTGFTGVTSVTFNGAGASITSGSATQIVVSAPNTGTNNPVDVVVTTPAGSSTEVAAFTNTSPPTQLWGISFYTDNNYTVNSFSLGGSGSPGPTSFSVNGPDSAGITALLNMPVGTVFTVVNGSMITPGDTFTLTGTFSGGAGSYSANADYAGSGYMGGGMSQVGQFSVA